MTLENGTDSQYGETNVLYFLFSLLRIKGIYMFRVLLAHSQEAIHKRYLVYWYIAHLRTKYTKCRFIASPEDEQVTLETCRGP
jgi:hypothetical protein